MLVQGEFSWCKSLLFLAQCSITRYVPLQTQYVLVYTCQYQVHTSTYYVHASTYWYEPHILRLGILPWAYHVVCNVAVMLQVLIIVLVTRLYIRVWTMYRYVCTCLYKFMESWTCMYMVYTCTSNNTFVCTLYILCHELIHLYVHGTYLCMNANICMYVVQTLLYSFTTTLHFPWEQGCTSWA